MFFGKIDVTYRVPKVEGSGTTRRILPYGFVTFTTSKTFSEHVKIKMNKQKPRKAEMKQIGINNVEFKGTDVYNKLSLKSTDFEIELYGDNLKITTKGYGHGVGMSQYGALGMAKEGYTYEEILKHYYKDTKVEKIGI